ncbi:DUF445 family protein, partial [uncultured Microbacterium sp.]
ATDARAARLGRSRSPRQVRDLQYIRLNGTIVGALAGLVIFTVAHLTWGS